MARKLSIVFALVWFAFAGTANLSAEELPKFWVTDQTNAYYVCLLAGSDSQVQLQCLREANAFRKLRKLPASATLTVIGTATDLDPIVKERVQNQGHVVLMMDKPERNPGAMEACVALRRLCDMLSQRFPKRAGEFRKRLGDAESHVRTRLGIQAAATNQLARCNRPSKLPS